MWNKTFFRPGSKRFLHFLTPLSGLKAVEIKSGRQAASRGIKVLNKVQWITLGLLDSLKHVILQH